VRRLMFFIGICIFLSGCSVLNLPGQTLRTIGRVFGLAEKTVETAAKVIETTGEVATAAASAPGVKEAAAGALIP